MSGATPRRAVFVSGGYHIVFWSCFAPKASCFSTITEDAQTIFRLRQRMVVMERWAIARVPVFVLPRPLSELGRPLPIFKAASACQWADSESHGLPHALAKAVLLLQRLIRGRARHGCMRVMGAKRCPSAKWVTTHLPGTYRFFVSFFFPLSRVSQLGLVFQ